tara:strand:+ start:2383 stop:2766 length:384 start_codon:yes stop_codon:yes gene_type:complete
MDKTKTMDKYLSDTEKEQLEYLNTTSNRINKLQNEKRDPFNMTLSELIQNWANANIHVLIDITNFFSNLQKYNRYFDDIDNTGQWFNGIKKFILDLSSIFVKKNRGIYIGFSLILLSFALHLIQITS